MPTEQNVPKSELGLRGSEERHSSGSLSTVQGVPFPGQVVHVRGLGKTHPDTNMCICQSGA